MNLALFIAIFFATMVETVETATFVLAASVHSPRQALKGTLAATAILVVAFLIGAPFIALIPITPLRIVMGVYMVYYGTKWLKKAILRASGRMAMRDEEAVYQKSVADKDAFKLSFNGALVEGTEVVILLLALSPGHLTLGGLAALAAILVVIAACAVIRAPLTKVPENTMKFAVGTLLVSFGAFWFGEGVGLPWPAGDFSLMGLIGLVLGVSLFMMRRLQPQLQEKAA